ncbi:hypothetical protein AOLI_G00296730 [Acnodon oligacanthus]
MHLAAKAPRGSMAGSSAPLLSRALPERRRSFHTQHAERVHEIFTILKQIERQAYQTGALFAGSYSEILPAAFVLLTQFPAVASVFPPYSPAPISISPGLAPSNLQHVLGVTARLASFGIGLKFNM